MRRRASAANLAELCSAGTPLGVSCSDLVLRRLVQIELRLLEPPSVPSMPSPETLNKQLEFAMFRSVSPCTGTVAAVEIRPVASTIPGSRTDSFLRQALTSNYIARLGTISFYVVSSGFSSVSFVALKEPPLHWDLRLLSKCNLLLR